MNTTVDPERTEAFAGQIMSDLATAISAALVHLGDRLGLYRTLAETGPVTTGELARRAGIAERYAREWLANQAASGYLVYDPAAMTFELPAEHAAVLADEGGPAFLTGGFESVAACYQVLDRMESAFRSGEGVGWHEHDHRLFCGVERFFRPSYNAFLLAEWIPALDGVQAKLARGGSMADVGCGHGASTLLLAGAFPASRFIGFDAHEASIRTARERADAAGLSERVEFACAPAEEITGGPYDLISFFDCLHDMGDPLAAARQARECLKPDGTLMLVEPLAGDRLEENLHPIGRAYYGFSTLVCTPASLAQDGRAALGAQAGEARLREILVRAGFASIRRAAESPAQLILEARP